MVVHHRSPPRGSLSGHYRGITVIRPGRRGPLAERVCVVAGSGAWPFYLATGAWVGQENRRFGDATRLGFYSGRQVHGLAPRIRHVVASVPLTAEDAATRAL